MVATAILRGEARNTALTPDSGPLTPFNMRIERLWRDI